jgi:nitrite reductase/ring-hydroxylating ferredoxin subunit
VIVARADEIGPGERKIVEIGGRSIGVFNIAGEYFALRNRCPHQGGPLCAGLQLASLSSVGPGEYERGEAGEVIRCPWHGWEFEIKTGRSWFDPQQTRVRSYPARIDAAPPPDAERYPARRDGAYVVVELDR